MIVYCVLGTAPTFMGIPCKMAGVDQVLIAFPDAAKLKYPLADLNPDLEVRIEEFLTHKGETVDHLPSPKRRRLDR